VTLDDPSIVEGVHPAQYGPFWEGSIKRDRAQRKKTRAGQEDNGSPGAEDAGTMLSRRPALKGGSLLVRPEVRLPGTGAQQRK